MMTPRERVLAALMHEPTDRAPADYGAHGEVTERLIARLGLRDEDGLREYLGVDLRQIPVAEVLPPGEPDDEGYITNMWGLRWQQNDEGLPVNTIYPFTEDSTADDVYAHPWPSADAVDYTLVRPACDKYADTYATVGAPWSPFFHEVGWLIGQDNFLVWMHTKPEVVHALLDCITGYELEVTRRFFELCAGQLDIAYFGNDFGTQRGLFISPQHFDEFIRPPLKRFYDLSHDYGCKVMQHSCGGVRDLLPRLLEDGLDILDPVQVRAAGMAPAGLYRDFGDRLSFHGAIDMQYTLPLGTADEVRAEVRAMRDLTRERGGYIVVGSQSYIAEVPDENILALYDENLRYA